MYQYKFKAFDVRTRKYYDGTYKCQIPPSSSDERLAVLQSAAAYLNKRSKGYLIPLYITAVDLVKPYKGVRYEK